MVIINFKNDDAIKNIKLPFQGEIGIGLYISTRRCLMPDITTGFQPVLVQQKSFKDATSG